ncbi:peptidylprolyl isomerase [Cohnella massiliensis]|uniref:peptidylprolyl isomerase n=1 Tax=Cohnella massiliensis TaxID=1816691 RepID=UPI0009BB1951|nr:peptidylprolyl isomerase [Cohnella massiliensis]
MSDLEKEQGQRQQNGGEPDKPVAAPIAPTAKKSGASVNSVLPWIITAIALIALVITSLGGAGESEASEAVGEVGGEQVTKTELYDEIVKQIGGETQAGQILDQYMLLRLFEYEAEKAGVEVADAEYDAAIEEIKQQNGFTTDEEFEQALAYSNLTLEDYKEQAIRPQLLLRGIFEEKLAPSDEDLKAYYEENQASFGTEEQVKASHILLDTKEEAEAVLKQLKEGADFATLAQEKSLDPGSKDSGGDLGFFGRGVMNEPFETAAFALNVGELSGVVESPNGFHIIKVTDKQEASVPAYEEVHDKVKAAYLDAKANEGFNEWYEQAKKDAAYKNLLTGEDATAAETAPSASAGTESPAAGAETESPAASGATE